MKARRRSQLVAEVVEARQAYQQGNVRRGTAADLMKELMGQKEVSHDYSLGSEIGKKTEITIFSPAQFQR